jgi:hypothetical protein
LVVVHGSHQQQRAVVRLHNERELVALERRFDGIEVVLANAAEKKVCVLRRTAHEPQQQLRHHLVGAGEVQQVHVREVDHRQRRTSPCRQQILDLRSHRRARGARHEVRIKIAHGAS